MCKKVDEKLLNGLLSFINSQDIDEFICKKVKCRRYTVNGIDDGDYYDCMDCIREFFSASCKWRAENDVCVNDKCEHCADFVSEVECGKCYFKELGDIRE